MSSPVNAGDILAGKYQVERVLGMGGMGVVVAAKHLILGERVAIKFLLPQALAREDVVKRFIQEGTAANRLRGEHIGRVHDVGRLESGAPFLVMEYLDGKDLGAILRDGGPLEVETAVDYVVQACEALAEAHSAGIIHRDLKPSNLFLIQRLDGSPSIKLIDFGISKVLVPGAEGEGGEMTQTAVMMGSPLYMAPEQMASARDVDGRADIWSLGIILHTMLTGQPPFRAPSVMQVYELIVQGAPPIRKQRASVPEGVEAAILKCLQKDRLKRFENVGELAEAIAPSGPPEARFVAERVKRILSARSTRDSMVVPASDPKLPVAVITPAAVATTEPAGSEGGAPSAKPAGDGPTSNTSNAGASSSIDSGGAYRSATLDAPSTGGPWDQNTGTPSRRRRPAALIAAGAAIVTGCVIGFLALRTTGQGPGAQPPPKPTQEPVVSADPTPTVVPGPSVAPSATTAVASPTATATTTATAEAKPIVPKRPQTGTIQHPPPPPNKGKWDTPY